MDYEFSSLNELYKRVKPALHAKETEFHRLGFKYIKAIDIWNYLIKEKWLKGKNLMLSDIVSDIMHVESKNVDTYLKGKISKTRRTQYSEDKIELLWGEVNEK